MDTGNAEQLSTTSTSSTSWKFQPLGFIHIFTLIRFKPSKKFLTLKIYPEDICEELLFMKILAMAFVKITMSWKQPKASTVE